MCLYDGEYRKIIFWSLMVLGVAQQSSTGANPHYTLDTSKVYFYLVYLQVQIGQQILVMVIFGTTRD